MKILSEFLIKNQTLTDIDLSWNTFVNGSSEILKILSEMISKNQTIVTLNLSGNEFGIIFRENLKGFFWKTYGKQNIRE